LTDGKYTIESSNSLNIFQIENSDEVVPAYIAAYGKFYELS
jgi:hypothetical protein